MNVEIATSEAGWALHVDGKRIATVLEEGVLLRPPGGYLWMPLSKYWVALDEPGVIRALDVDTGNVYRWRTDDVCPLFIHVDGDGFMASTEPQRRVVQ